MILTGRLMKEATDVHTTRKINRSLFLIKNLHNYNKYNAINLFKKCKNLHACT